MEKLPQEIALNIISRLPIKSLVRFKCVSKAWFSLAPDPNLLSIYQANSTEKDPILVLHSEHPHDDDQLHFIKNNHNQLEALVKNLDPALKPPVPNFEIAGSCNGFLCLYDPQDTIYLYNPLTHESIKLPPTNINFSNQKLVLGFGFHPRTKEYKIIRTAYCFPRDRGFLRPIGYGSSDTSIYTLGAENQSWKSLGRAAYWLDRRSPMALVTGIVHWLTQCHKYKQYHEIISFDLATEEYNKVPYPSCASFRRNFYSIVALGGYLCAFVQSNYYGKIEMWVMKNYNVKESWTKDYIIPAYSPVGLYSHNNLPHRMRDKWFIRGSVRVICLLKNGGILLEYGNQVLVSYDPEKDEFKDLNFYGLPKFFESVTVMGSLLSLQDTINKIQK